MIWKLRNSRNSTLQNGKSQNRKIRNRKIRALLRKKATKKDIPPDGGSLEVAVDLRKQRHTEFVKLWCKAYEEAYGDRYQVTPQDAKALKGFLAVVDIEAPVLFEAAKIAWSEKSNKRMFKCGHSGSIMGYLKWRNDIIAELRDAHKLPDAAGTGSGKWNDIARG